MDDAQVTTVVGRLVASLRAAIASTACMSRFAKYVTARKNVRRWFIAADFCIGDASKSNDTLAFTVIPEDASVTALFDEISTAGTNDIKNVKNLSETMIECLAADHRFTFAFVMNRSARRMFGSLPSTRAVITELRAHFEDSRGALARAGGDAAIKRWLQLEQKVKAKNFKDALFSDMSLIAIIAALIGVLIMEHGEPEVISWIPDRDNMTTAFDGAVHDLFSNLLWSWGASAGLRPPQVEYPTPDQSPGGVFYDPFVRIPDYIASTLASCAYGEGVVTASAPKFLSVLQEVVADNPHLCVFEMAWDSDNFPVVKAMQISVQSIP